MGLLKGTVGLTPLRRDGFDGWITFKDRVFIIRECYCLHCIFDEPNMFDIGAIKRLVTDTEGVKTIDGGPGYLTIQCEG